MCIFEGRENSKYKSPVVGTPVRLLQKSKEPNSQRKDRGLVENLANKKLRVMSQGVLDISLKETQSQGKVLTRGESELKRQEMLVVNDT